MSAQHKAGTDTYTINELCRKLGMSRPQVFELISMNVFRSIHVKGCTRISKPSFDEWITYCDVPKKKSSKSRNPRTQNKSRGINGWFPELIEIRKDTYQYIDPYGNVEVIGDSSELTSENGERAPIEELIDYIISLYL